jgi:hypothetical protein
VRIGQTAFLKKYANGVGAKTHYILFEGELCDMKAVWGAAHNPRRLPRTFNTSEARLYLPHMGFKVITEAEAKVFAEGKRRIRETSYFQRHPKVVSEAKKAHGFECMVCGFNFEKQYGDIGRGYIECHHLREMAIDEERETNIADVAVVCSNCHRMLHSGGTLRSIEQLKKS